MDLDKSIKNSKKRLFHSNGYASISAGDRLGSATHESFGARQQVERNRSVVMGYGRSSIGVGYNNKTHTKSIRNHINVNPRSDIISARKTNKIAQPRAARKYDPYSS